MTEAEATGWKSGLKKASSETKEKSWWEKKIAENLLYIIAFTGCALLLFIIMFLPPWE